MQIVFLIYANSRTDPLPTLREEDEKTHAILARRSKLLHFNIHRDSFGSVNSIIEYLQLHREEIIVFAYSGHAGRDLLLLEDEKTNAQGIAGLLRQCPKLQLVLLNGCSTAGQVQQLLELPSQPVVIATSAPVGDNSATRFGVSFFRELGEKSGTIEEAFQAGLSAAKTVKEIERIESRDTFHIPNEVEEEKELWGIYSNNQAGLKWKLPVEPDVMVQRQQTISWLKWWGIYQLIGLVIMIGFIGFQVPSSSFLLELVPVFYFFAPFLPTLRTQLPQKRLFILIGFHALLYFVLLSLWMKDDMVKLLIFLFLGLILYFGILPMIKKQR